MFHVLETSHYLCTINHQPMNIDRNIKVGFMPEADEFLYSLPYKVYQKVVYNIHKVEQGVLDKELFKKLDDTDIWEFRTLFNGNIYRMFAFWDTETETLIIATHGIIKKTQKNAPKGDCKSGIVEKGIF